MNEKIKTYQIRYNTVSKTENERWRLIENGNETLVSDIIIDGHTYTTKDWIPEINDYKWHISCTGYCIIKNNIAYVTSTKKYSFLNKLILKTISYSFFGGVTMVGITFLLNVSLKVSILLVLSEFLIKSVIYFANEFIWNQ